MWVVSLLEFDTDTAGPECLGWVLVRHLELGWWFKRSSWARGKGYPTEAADAVKQSFIDIKPEV